MILCGRITHVHTSVYVSGRVGVKCTKEAHRKGERENETKQKTSIFSKRVECNNVGCKYDSFQPLHSPIEMFDNEFQTVEMSRWQLFDRFAHFQHLFAD